MDFNPEDLAGKPIPPSLYRAVVPDRVLLSLNDTGITCMPTSVFDLPLLVLFPPSFVLLLLG